MERAIGCARARELLPEHVLGTLDAGARGRLSEHLGWCAGCRREEAELAAGAEVIAHAAAAEPPAHLEERVVAAVVRAAGGRRARPRPRLAAALVAALLAVAVAGWGAAIAGRDQPPDPAVSRAAAEAAARDFGLVVGEIGFPVREAVLESVDDRDAGGRALLYDAGEGGSANWILVFVGGLPEDGTYRARALGDLPPMSLGRLFPSTEGRLAAYKLFGGDTLGLDHLVVEDETGAVVLSGDFSAP